MADKDILAEGREAFELAYEAETENRTTALEDLRFARLGEQWPKQIEKDRLLEGRPVLTINRMPSFIRQVVNDSRQNKPQIKVKGVDNKADAKTARVIEGLIRNIEYVSKADVAYDTAVEFAATMGFGYIRLAIDYEYDDTFDKGLRIQRISNPFSVYGDPHSTEADSSDWNQCHVVEYQAREEFRIKYKGAEEVDWDATGYTGLELPWKQEEEILVCEAWSREKTKRKILLLSDGSVVGETEYKAAQDILMMAGITPVNERETHAYKITQRIMTGAEVLEENEWAGQYIPVIPVYGEELNIEGKRLFRGIIHHAKDAQRMFNYWRTTATELVALAPRVPYIGEFGAFDDDPNWSTANSKSHPYLMYKRGGQMPQRQPLDSGSAAGALQEAMLASDDMKSIIGLHDASLGQRSNETSGKAIMARQREGDVSTYHIIDNLARAIRHTACCLVDLIPKVYTGQRVIRILGLDGKEEVARLGQKPEAPSGLTPADVEPIYDLAVGKYDVAVKSGPSYTTQREETREQLAQTIQSFPDSAPILAPELAKLMDLPNAEEIAKRFEAMMPAQAKGGLPPELDKMIQEGKKRLGEQEQEIQSLKADVTKGEIEKAGKDVQIKQLQAEKQLRQQAEAMQAQMLPPEPPAPQQPVNVNLPQNLGESIVQIVVPAIVEAVKAGVGEAIGNIPPLNVNMPPPQRMRRIPIRDKNGIILETRDELITDEMVN